MNWYKTSFKGMPLLIVITALNAATFWPLAFDVIDFVSKLLGYDSKYTSFEVMPIIFYVAWFVFAAAISVIAIKLCLSIVSVLAVYSENGNGDSSNPNTVTNDFVEKNHKHYTTMSNMLIVLFVSFGIGLYQQDVRFDQIQLINDVDKHKRDIHILEVRLNKLKGK